MFLGLWVIALYHMVFCSFVLGVFFFFCFFLFFSWLLWWRWTRMVKALNKCLVYFSPRCNYTNARQFMDCQSMQCPVLISTLLCSHLTFLSSLWLGWCQLLSQQAIVRLVFSFKMFNSCVCGVGNQLITCCQRAHQLTISKMPLAQILWVRKIAESNGG